MYDETDALVPLIQHPLMLMEKLDLSSPGIEERHLTVDSDFAGGRGVGCVGWV